MQLERKRARLGVIAALALTAAASVQAQDRPDGEGIGPTVAIDAGLSTGNGGTGATIGGSVRLDVSRRLAVEVAGAYLDRGRGEGGASGLASLLVNLRPSDQKVVPYLALGGGIYQSSFEGLDARRMAGPDGRAGRMAGPDLQDFIGRFMRGYMDAGNGASAPWLDFMLDGRMPDGRMGRASSTDPALSIGGGIRIDLGHNLYLSPDARALVVFRDADTRTIGTLHVGLGYRF